MGRASVTVAFLLVSFLWFVTNRAAASGATPQEASPSSSYYAQWKYFADRCRRSRPGKLQRVASLALSASGAPLGEWRGTRFCSLGDRPRSVGQSSHGAACCLPRIRALVHEFLRSGLVGRIHLFSRD